MTFPILGPHHATPTDLVVSLGLVVVFPLFLTTPLTPGWRLIRGAIFAPLSASVFLYIILFIAHNDFVDQWGVPILMFWFAFQCLSFLLFWPPEEHVYRLRPAPKVESLKISEGKLVNGFKANGHAPAAREDQAAQPQVDLLPEPVPPPWTWAKFCWATSLWWSWRCIGWSNSCILPPSARRHPYTRQSSRKDYLVERFKFFIITWLARDFVRAYVVFSRMAPFFQDTPGAKSYVDMSTLERAHVSLVVVAWVWLSMEKSHVPASMLCVGLGGIFGWEGEIWEPWGWPPLFGGLGDFWTNPSLSHAWSRSWHQYNRNFLYQYAWKGLGENLLGLPPSGPSVRPLHPAKEPGSASSSMMSTPLATPGLTPNASGRASPSHPIPTTPTQSTRRLRLPSTLNNLIKSVLVFTLTGLHHDQSMYLILKWYNYPGSPWLASTPKDAITPGPNPYMKGTDGLITTPFFAVQPLALVVEAVLKRQWRAWKVRNHPEWFGVHKPNGISNGVANGHAPRRTGEPDWLVFAERLINFTFTWVWLGWSAAPFVAGLPKTGALKRMTGQADQFSLMGGLAFGQWYH